MTLHNHLPPAPTLGARRSHVGRSLRGGAGDVSTQATVVWSVPSPPSRDRTGCQHLPALIRLIAISAI